jgi:hypothetical protein
MHLLRLDSENAADYVGYYILFKSRNDLKLSKITSVSDSGKTINIDHGDLGGTLQTVTRVIYVVIQ